MKKKVNISKKQVGIIGASAIVAGNIMGAGISLLPASLAAIGSITIISWFITFIGILALAYVFSHLGLIDPQTGGPVMYAKKLSPILGYQTGLLYWLANWIGNLAIAITGVEYLSVFYHPLTDPIIGGLVTIAFVWLFTILNFYGADKIVKIVSITVFLLLIPVIGTALFGWFHFSANQFIINWNVSQFSSIKAIFLGIILAIWSFIGIESASVSAGVVKKPNITIPLATMTGTCLAAIAYIASTTVISGMFPAKVIASSGAPFAIAFGAIVGKWVQPYVLIFTAVACLASLGSWMMILGQAGMAAANNHTLPKIFGLLSKNHKIPAAGITINSILMTLLMIGLMIISYIKKESATSIFGEIISIAVLLTLLPYLYSSIYMLRIEKLNKKNALSFIASIVACILCFIAFAGAQNLKLILILIVSLFCFILYAIKQSKFMKKE